jgi:membrane protease YdiL (CAAX protease family)
MALLQKQQLRFPVALAVALLFWMIAFTVRAFNFWLLMALAAIVLIALADWVEGLPQKWWGITPRDLLVGVVSGALLWLLFEIGSFVTAFLPFQREQIVWFYARKADIATWALPILLVLICTAEEVFWRGVMLRRLSRALGPWRGLQAATAIYVLAHIWAGNLMLLIAALVAGAIWGWLYLRTGRLAPVIISHILFDLLLIVIFPLA